MPTTHPRVTAVVERPLYEAIAVLAHRDGTSLSQKVRDLLHGALEIVEDAGLEALVEARRNTSKTTYSLAETKRRFKHA